MENHINILDKGFVELIDSMGNDNTIVSAARVSFMGESKGNEKDAKLIHYLKKNHHDTPFEMVEFTFRVKCPLFIRSQWMRHRMWSYNEVSRRYTSEDIDFYIPSQLRKQGDTNRQASKDEYIEDDFVFFYNRFPYKPSEIIAEYSRNCLSMYEDLIEKGVAREQARMVLPQNMYTMFYAKTDLRNLFHFIDLRNSEHAQWEMRLYAQALYDLVEPIVPVACEAWRVYL